GGAAWGIEGAAADMVVHGKDASMGPLCAMEYGYGRTAILGTATPLRDEALASAPGTAFAEDVFEWLARAGQDRHDMDGDSLPDGMEDANDNGTVDTGETSFLLADSDGDGIPD